MESIWIKEIKADRNCVTYHLDVSEGLVRYFSPSCEMFAEFGFDISNIPKSILQSPSFLILCSLRGCLIALFGLKRWINSFMNAYRRLSADFKKCTECCS